MSDRFPPEAYTPGQGDPVPRHRRNLRRAYDREGREIRPMDLANAAQNGVSSVRATCRCGHVAEVAIARFPPEMPVPDVGLRLRCSACGRRGPETVPVWKGRETGL